MKAVKCEIYAIKSGGSAFIVRARFTDASGAMTSSMELGHFTGGNATRSAMRASYLAIKGSVNTYTDGNLLVEMDFLPDDT